MLKKLANGEYSLKVTFWLFGIFGSLVFAFITNITHSSLLRTICGHLQCNRSVIWFFFSNFVTVMTKSTNAFRWFVVIHSLLSAMFVAYMLIVIKGLWKSCAKSESGIFWSMSAKAVLLLLSLIYLKSII